MNILLCEAELFVENTYNLNNSLNIYQIEQKNAKIIVDCVTGKIPL